jgi:hypothetical protein
MDKSLQQLEDELKSLRLRRPSPQLTDRLTSELVAETDGVTAPARRYTTQASLGSWKWLGWRTAGLAAALVVGAALGVVFFRSPSRPSLSQPEVLAANNPPPVQTVTPVTAVRESYAPVAATNVLYDLQDEGLVNAGSGQPARQVRARYLDTYTLKDPRSNASLKWSVPRDEIRVIPASLH